MTNPLTNVIPAAWRKYLYAAFGFASLVVGALLVAGVDVGPASDVLTYVGAALGLTAASNTDTSGEGE